MIDLGDLGYMHGVWLRSLVVVVLLPLVALYQHVGRVQGWSMVTQSPVLGHKPSYRENSGMNNFR